MNSIRINKVVTTIIFLFTVMLIACNNKENSSIEQVTDLKTQESIFHHLISLSQNAIPDAIQSDSLAFLILPVQASCPSCRNKTIDSIVKHSGNLANRHFIIISATGGRKTINGFFRENDKELPTIQNKLFLDSTNTAYKYKLYDEKPTIYYTCNRKAYKKVGAIPRTVKEDLREFFSGYRNYEN